MAKKWDRLTYIGPIILIFTTEKNDGISEQMMEKGKAYQLITCSLYSNINSSARYSSLRQCMSATPSLISTVSCQCTPFL